MTSVNCVCRASKEEGKKLEKEVQTKTDSLLAKLEKFLGPEAAQRRLKAKTKGSLSPRVSKEARATQRARARRPGTVLCATRHNRSQTFLLNNYYFILLLYYYYLFLLFLLNILIPSRYSLLLIQLLQVMSLISLRHHLMEVGKEYLILTRNCHLWYMVQEVSSIMMWMMKR